MRRKVFEKAGLYLSIGLFLAAPAAMAAGEIQLVDASSRVTSYRGPAIQTLTADILVKNPDPAKKVGIRYRNQNGSWADAWGSYLYTLGDGRERWQVNASPCNPYHESDCTATDPDFAVQMQAGTQSYWDNNGGANYHLNSRSGYRLANGFKVFTLSPGMIQRASSPGSGLFLTGRVLLENLGPGKTVKLVYSLDGWRTRAEEPLTFLDATQAYPPERFTNPGEFGGEVWFFSFNPPEGRVLEYFIQYTVNGQAYYDSNFGSNYRLAIPEFPNMTVRGTPTGWQPQYAWAQSGTDASYDYSTVLDVSGHDPRERFKFDVSGDWSVNFGENDNGGNSRSGTAERSGGDIFFQDGPGLYRVKFENRTHAFSVQKEANSSPVKRTLVFIHGRTVEGQNLFIRGGIDHEHMQDVLGKTCNDSATYTNPCAIPIRHRIRTSDNPDFYGDFHLDWYGREDNQTATTEGSPLTWTTGAATYERTVAKDGFGYTPLNRYGEHYWMLDVDMDCSRTVDGWFELKSFISNGAGWERDIAQPGAPYASRNHMGQCGKINIFRHGENAAEIQDF